MSEAPDSEVRQSGPPVRRLVDRHLALICAFALVLLATLRVYFVAGFDMPTALTVLAIVDRAQLLTATVLTGLAVVVPLLFIQPAFRRWLWAGNIPGAGFSRQVRTALLWIPISGVVMFAFSIPLAAGWFAGWMVALLVKRRAKRKARKNGRRGYGRQGPLDADSNTWLAATLLGVTLLTLLYQPWLAREAVRIADGEQVVANVVGVQGEMTLLLENSSARWVATADIESRAICRTNFQWWTATLSSLIPRKGENCAAILEAKDGE